MTGSSDSAPSGGIVCPVCRAALPGDATFCLMCGTRQTLRPAAPVRVNLGREATMLGLAPTGSDPPREQPASVRDTLKDAGGAPAAEPKRVANQHRTMMGMQESAAPATPASRSKTLTGAAGSAPVPSAQVPEVRPVSGRTMQGLVTPPASPVPAPHEPAMTAARRREIPPLMGALASTPAPRSPREVPRSAPPPPEELQVPGLAPRRATSAARYVAAVFAVLGIGGLTAGLLLRARQAAPPLNAFVSGTDGDHVTLTVAAPEAAGARLRTQGQVVDIDAAGRATVRVPARAVGELRLPATLERSGNVEERELRYFIAWRVEPRFNELGGTPPRLLLEFHVPGDATLEVSRHPVRVVNGVGIASIDASAPLSVQDLDGARRYTFPVRVTRGGATTEGQYALRVRRTPLRVEEPGRLTATATTMINVQGTAPRATRVTVGGANARVDGDRFTADVALVPGPNNIEVVAYAPGGVPASARLVVYQNVSPEAYLSAAMGDHGPSLLVAPRDGARIQVRGTVLRAMEAGADGPTFQMLVADRACPGGQCVAWVDPPRRTAVRAGQQVLVTGELQRSRAYVAADGVRRSAPVVQALFVQ